MNPESQQHQAKIVTFEEGYADLKRISKRLDEDNVPVDEIADLTARGKSLAVSLRDYLDKQEARIAEIEKGEGLPLYEIAAAPRLAKAPEPALVPEPPVSSTSAELAPKPPAGDGEKPDPDLIDF